MTALRRGPLLLLAAIGAGTIGWVVVSGNRHEQPNAPVRVAWLFEAVPRGAIVSSPLVEGDHIYIGAIEDDRPPRGAVYCLHADTGRVKWKFHDQGRMQHMYSSPCLAEGRLYIGEGMHANPRSKLYCLDAATGHELWSFVAQGHIESTPTWSAGCVYFGAGDDGVYCLEAESGAELWHWFGEHHVDATLEVVQGRVYGGSGISRLRHVCEAFCLDAKSGQVVWRTPMDLPAWGSPRVDRGQVFVGLGNGRLVSSVEPPDRPAGAVVCLQAEGGSVDWRFDTPDGVLVCSTIDDERVFFGARDAYGYCLDRQDGRPVWKQPLGSPIVASATLHEGNVYLVGSEGQVYCLDAANGRIHWTFDVATASGARPRLFSTPAVLSNPGRGTRLVFGAELRGWSSSAAVVYCLNGTEADQP